MRQATPQLDLETLRSMREYAREVRSFERITNEVLDRLIEGQCVDSSVTQLEHAKQLLVAGYQAAGLKASTTGESPREMLLV